MFLIFVIGVVLGYALAAERCRRRYAFYLRKTKGSEKNVE